MRAPPRTVSEVSEKRLAARGIAELPDADLDILDALACDDLFRYKSTAFTVSIRRFLSAILRLRRSEAERDRLRAEVEKLRAENARLREGLATFGIREVTCGVDGYRCGMCVACGGHESEPPPIVVEVAK